METVLIKHSIENGCTLPEDEYPVPILVKDERGVKYFDAASFSDGEFVITNQEHIVIAWYEEVPLVKVIAGNPKTKQTTIDFFEWMEKEGWLITDSKNRLYQQISEELPFEFGENNKMIRKKDYEMFKEPSRSLYELYDQWQSAKNK